MTELKDLLIEAYKEKGMDGVHAVMKGYAAYQRTTTHGDDK